MNEIIKGFQQFVNEGQGPAHQLYRKVAAKTQLHNRDYTKPVDWNDIATDYKKLKMDDPAEADRFAKLSKRLTGHRERTGKKDLIKQLDPKMLAFLIAGNFGNDGDTWPIELAHEFVNGDMSIDQLKSRMIELSGRYTATGDHSEIYANQVITAALQAANRKLSNAARK